MLTRFLRWLVPSKKATDKTEGVASPVVVPRAKHNITRENISKNALKVLYRLNKNGYQAYLVGGGVRDLLLEREPKDFDVVTNAHPEEIRSLFRNCRLIGRRFRLAHVFFGNEIIEVATFRAAHTGETKQSSEGMLLQDNVYGTMDEDVIRRDFTANAIYYNISDYSIVDYVNGLEAIDKKQLSLIGNPEVRYREDPVRMLRAVRFAAKLGFSIHPESESPIFELSHLLSQVPIARLFEEYMKLFLGGSAEPTYDLLLKYGLFSLMFPQIQSFIDSDEQNSVDKLLRLAFKNTDDRISEGKPVAPGFLIAVILWHPLVAKANELISMGHPEYNAFQEAIDIVLDEQRRIMSVPRRFSQMVREIWQLQIRLKRRSGRRAVQLFAQPRFRAAYDFLILRTAAGDEEAQPLSQWWQTYIESDDKARWAMAKSLKDNKGRRRRSKKKSNETDQNSANEEGQSFD